MKSVIDYVMTDGWVIYWVLKDVMVHGGEGVGINSDHVLGRSSISGRNGGNLGGITG